VALLTATFTDLSVAVTPDQRAELAALPQVDPYLVWAMLVSAFQSNVDPNANSPTRIAIVAEVDQPTRVTQFGFPSFLMPASAPELRIVPALLDWEGLLDLLSKPPDESGVKRFELSVARGTRGEAKSGPDDQVNGTLFTFESIPRQPASDGLLTKWLDARQSNAGIRAKSRGFSEDASSPEELNLKAQRPLVCVVDDGCNFASSSMLTGAVSRIASIWHQGNDEETTLKLDSAAGWRPAVDVVIGIGGGGGIITVDLSGGWDGRKLRIPGHIGGFREAGSVRPGAAAGSEEALSLPEPAIYAATAYPERLNRWTHGSAVLGLIAGDRPWGVGAQDAKGRIPWGVTPGEVCFVQLPDATVLDTSGGSLASHALDAIRHALSQAVPGQHVIVNLSYGTHSGGHDATSIWDAGLKELLDTFDGINPASQRKTLHVVLPAGNSHLWRIHAHKCLHGQGADNELAMKWKVQPDNPAEAFLEIWLPPGAEFRIDVNAPDGTKLSAQSPDPTGSAPTLIETAGEVPKFALIWPTVVPQSRCGSMALLAVAPTARWSDRFRWGNGITRRGFRDQLTPAPHGIWTVRVSRVLGPGGQAVHAWVQRSDSAPGRPRRAGHSYAGRQSYFVEHTGHSVAPEFTLNGLASLSHPRLYVVGAMRRSDASLSDYSAAGPNRIDPGRCEGPDRVVVADESLNVPGLLTQGFFGGGRVRLSGTSLAAAAFTRLLYEDLVAKPGRGPMNTPFVDRPSREPPVPAGNPAHAAPVFRGEYRRILPDHPFGLLTRWPTRRK
jgi:hypothetical protein